MGFQFSLAAVLRIRGMVEEREERLLRQILLEIAQTVEHLEHTNREIAGSYASLGQDTGKPSAGHQLHAAYGEVKALSQTRNDLESHIEKLKQLRDKQLIVYEAARRDREMLSDMHEEKRNAYDADMARREQKVLDDNYIARRSRS